jgi:hypothetical protein
VPDIVVAITKGPLSVFPGLPPVDRGEGEEEGARGEGGEELREEGGGERFAKLEGVVVGGVVVETRGEAGGEAGGGREDDVAFSRMEVSGGGVAPEGPPGGPNLLPSGEGEGKFKKPGEGSEGEVLWRREGHVEGREGRGGYLLFGIEEGEGDRGSSKESPERIWLVAPVHVPRRGSISVEVVFGPQVVGEDAFEVGS